MIKLATNFLPSVSSDSNKLLSQTGQHLTFKIMTQSTE